MSLELTVAVIGLCLALQAFFAGTEIALVSCDKVKMRALADGGSRSAALVLKAYDEIERFISTSLIGINLSLIVSTIVLTFHIEERLGRGGELYTVAILSPLIVVLGQVVPKAVFQQRSNTMVLWAIYPLWAFRKLMSPVLFFIDGYTQWITKVVGGRTTPLITRDELTAALSSGTVEKSRKIEIVRRVFDFSETKAEEVMIPLINLTSVSHHTPVRGVIEVIKRTGYSRIPIYRDRVDNITGIVHAFNLLGAELDTPVGELAKPPYYVPETKPVDELLDEMKRHSVGMAILVDEYGGAVGAVTIEDILEEIVGEIEDEYDKGVKLWRQIGPDEYLVNARIEIDALNKELGLDLPWGDYETLSGFILSRTGSIPKVGDKIRYGDAVFTVTKATPKAIEEVRVKKG